MGRNIVRSIGTWVGPALIWFGLLALAWPPEGFFQAVPRGPDTLEVMWALEWYRRALTEGLSPWMNPHVFFPQGWHPANLAHNPFLIGGMLPLAALGGDAFAYNMFGWLTLSIAFAGAYRLARTLVGDSWAATAVGVFYALFNSAYGAMREYGGHLHIAWGMALLPLVLWRLERARRQGWAFAPMAQAGILWGLAVAGQLYMGLLLGVPWLIYAVLARRVRRLLTFGLATVGPLIVISGPWVALFLWAFRQDDMVAHSFRLFLHTGLDWAYAFRWNPYSPLRWGMEGKEGEGLAQAFTSPSLGLLPWLTGGIAGLWMIRLRRRPLSSGPLAVAALLSALLATGLVIRWQGSPMEVAWPPGLARLMEGIWAFGYRWKPGFFEHPAIPAEARNLLYSPLFFLWIGMPFTEMGAALTRFIGVTVLGGGIAAAEALTRSVSLWIRRGCFILWLIESVMRPMAFQEWPPPLHPAYAWLREAPPGAVIELNPPFVTLHSSAALVATLIHGHPTVNGWGSFYPRWLSKLEHLILGNFPIHPLEALGFRYVLIHRPSENMMRIFGGLDYQCWASPTQDSPWPNPICVFILPEGSYSRFTNVFLAQGWSAPEGWGIWAQGTEAMAIGVLSRTVTATLEIVAFPHCVPSENQSLEIWVDGQRLPQLTFEGCREMQIHLPIPSRLHRGMHEVRFRFAYARSPAEATEGRNPDPRPLSVGFRRIWLHTTPTP